jgi:predicted MFS family arabinose efflux permease
MPTFSSVGAAAADLVVSGRSGTFVSFIALGGSLSLVVGVPASRWRRAGR